MKRSNIAISMMLMWFAAQPMPILATEMPKAGLERLIQQFGLGHLPPPDRRHLYALLEAVVRASSRINARQRRLAELAERYFTAKGYRLLYVQIVNVHNQDWLVVTNTFGSYATSDIPIGFPISSFENGYYFCHPGAISGIQSMLGDDGEEYDFTLANWKDLP